MSEHSADREGIIRVMPESLANKIAAGEVVQRPASAAKELIENAIDSGADQIAVHLKSAGSELIQVVDNGCGMTAADALLSLRRHATSKIQSIEDLEHIVTLGFRGEALASIAAVSQLELRTRRINDEAGYCLRADGGRIVDEGPCAAPPGTSVSVRNLFFNVPVRRNFLKTPATELKHLIDTFQFLALSNPEIGFTLTHEEAEVYRLAPARDASFLEALRRRIGGIFGTQTEENIVQVEETTSYLSARGFIARPTLGRRVRGEQFLFVNGRFVRHRSLEHAISSSYERLIPEGTSPFFVLFLTLDPRHIDVNVHPTKAEIKFDDERGVYGFLHAVVRRTLGMADMGFQVESSEERPGDGAAPTARPATFAPSFSTSFEARPSGSTGRSAGFSTSWERERPSVPAGELTERLYQPFVPPSPTRSELMPSGVPAFETSEEPTEDESLMWQLNDRYILTQIRSGLMLLDQNAAHERILYERALQSIRNGFGLSQQLLFPTTIEFTAADFELVKELLPDLRSLGFDVEPFSGRSVVVRGVPADIRTGDERSVLDDIIQQYKSYRDTLQIKTHENLARSVARRSAIQPGKKLSSKEMRALIDQLFLCEMPYACPQGRPTIIKISFDELEKRFGK